MMTRLLKLLLIVALFGAFVSAQSPWVPQVQLFDSNGDPLASGKVYTYIAGTTTPQATYTTSTVSVPNENTNPVILSSAGRANIWLDETKSYRFDVKTSANVVIYSVDNITAGFGGVIHVDGNLDVGIGAVSDGSKLYVAGNVMIDGQVDEVQLTIQGFSTQTSKSLVVENSGGTDVFTVSNTGAIVATAITDSGLTAGRLTLIGVGGLLADDSDLTFATDTLSATKVAMSSLTSGRVSFSSTAGLQVDDGDLTFVTDTLSATKVAMSSLTSGRLPISSTAGLQVDDADLTFATDTLSATKLISSTSIMSPLLFGGTGTTSPLTLKTTSGVGADGADIIFQVGNAGATEAMRVFNSGFVRIGPAGTPALKLEVGSMTAGWANSNTPGVANFTGSNGTVDQGGQVRIMANDSAADDMGGMLTFGGYNSTTAASLDFAGVAGRKETGGTTAGYLALSTRLNASAGTEKMRITSTGLVGIGTSLPSYLLHLKSTGAAEIISGIETTDASSVTAGSTIYAKASTADLSMKAFGAGHTASRWGVTMGSYSEIAPAAGNGLIVGTRNSAPLMLGTNATVALTFSTSQRATFAGPITATALDTSSTGTAIIIDAGNIIRPLTSSERFKANMRKGWSLESDKETTFLDLAPMVFNYLDADGNAVAGDDVLGFSAEDIFDSGLKYLVNLDKEGRPLSIREHAFLGYFADLIKKLTARVAVLEDAE